MIPDVAMRYFTELGRRIEDRWRRADRDVECFADLAAEEVERTPHGSDVEGIVGSYLSGDAGATRQLAPAGVFGQPGLTLYFGRGFVIDVYFWSNAVPAIHNHPFAGCFTLLKGFSLHDRYTFEPRERLGARVMIGEMEPIDLKLLREGDTVRFSVSRFPLIHSLVHVPNPTVSMVVRTVHMLDYFRYFPPSIAIAMEDCDDLTARQIQLIDWLRRSGSPSYWRHVEGFLETSDFETTFRLLSAVWAHGDTSRLIELARRRHGDRADLIAPCIEGAARLHLDNAYREQFEDDDARMVASILMCSHDRGDVFRLLREWFPDRDPIEVVRQWSGIEDAEPAARDELDELLRGARIDERWRDTVFRALALPTAAGA